MFRVKRKPKPKYTISVVNNNFGQTPSISFNYLTLTHDNDRDESNLSLFKSQILVGRYVVSGPNNYNCNKFQFFFILLTDNPSCRCIHNCKAD